MSKLSARMQACLESYAKREHDPDRRTYPPYRYTMREVNTALDRDWMMVGPGGWHVLTPAGREALLHAKDTDQ